MLKARKIVFSALAMAMMVSSAVAQSTDEVLGKYYDAIGGVDAWTNLTSMKASGTLDVMGMVNGPFTIVQKRPAMARIEITVQGMDIVQAFDGETAWQIMPMMGVTEPTRADPETAQQIIEQADLDGPLVGWQEDGYTVDFEGVETMDGAETTKLKITSKDGLVTYYYLDGEYLPVKMVSVRSVQGLDTELTTSLGDYQAVNGMMFPFFIEIDTPMGAQQLTFDSIEVNIPVDESIFSMSSGG
ncbi:MAG: outer membrane lipoprotein-sorting protein [Gemmatimonadota bacterium]|nr:outer membrane lipoprotein-sorting protein [Gemmatimonadota bacterium]